MEYVKIMEREHIIIKETISDFLRKSENISKYNGKKYLTRKNLHSKLSDICNKYTLETVLDCMEQDGLVSFSSNRTSPSSQIYFEKSFINTPKRFLDTGINTAIENLSKTEKIIKDKVTIKKIDVSKYFSIEFLLPLLGIGVSTYFTYYSLSDIDMIVIRWSLAIICSVFSSITLAGAFTKFNNKSPFLGTLYILLFIPVLIYNGFHSVNYLYQYYELERVKAVDPKIRELNSLLDMRESYQDLIDNNKISISGYELNIESYKLEMNTNNNDKIGQATYWLKKLTSDNKEYIKEIAKLDKKIKEMGSVSQESSKTIYQTIGEQLGFSADLLFMIISLIPSLITDLLSPVFMAIVISSKNRNEN